MATGDRQRLAELMDYSLAEQQLTWEEVAQHAGKGGSVAQLRAIRSGRSGLTVRTKLAIERGLRWPEGTVDAILANDQKVIAAVRSGFFTPVAPTGPVWMFRPPRPGEMPDLHDEVERELWEIAELSEDTRAAYINRRRRRLRQQGATEPEHRDAG